MTAYDFAAKGFSNDFKIIKTLRLGCLICVQFEVDWKHENFPRNFDVFYSDTEKAPYWSSGVLLRDKAGRIFLSTCHHSVRAFLKQKGAADTSPNIPNLLFFSAILSENENEQHMIEIGNSWHGYQGPSHVSNNGAPDLIDSLLIQVSEDFLAEPHVDMTVYDEADQPIELALFKENIDTLVGVKVTMNGSVSGKRFGRIVDVNSMELCVTKTPCKNHFVVVLHDGFNNNNFARHGDSGALVYGLHPQTNKMVAIGKVIAGQSYTKTPSKYISSKTGESFTHITYCALLHCAIDYWNVKENLDLEIYNPQSKPSNPGDHTDSGFVSVENSPEKNAEASLNTPVAETSLQGEATSELTSMITPRKMPRSPRRRKDEQNQLRHNTSPTDSDENDDDDDRKQRMRITERQQSKHSISTASSPIVIERKNDENFLARTWRWMASLWRPASAQAQSHAVPSANFECAHDEPIKLEEQISIATNATNSCASSMNDLSSGYYGDITTTGGESDAP